MGLVFTKRVGEAFSVDGPAVIYIDRTRGAEVTVRIVAERSVFIKRDADKAVDRFNPDCEHVARK